MAEIKWIKINTDMFDNRKIKQIRKMPGGNDMVLFWVMLLTLAGRANSQGYILFTENIAYTPEMLASECDFELQTVKIALSLFQKFDMITMSEEKIMIDGWAEHQNVDGMERAKMLANARVKRHREKKKALSIVGEKQACTEDETLQETLQQRSVTALEERNKNKKEELDIEEDKEIIITTNSNSSDDSSDKKVSNVQVFKHFEKCGFRLTPLQYEEIATDIETYSSYWVMDAAKEASNRGKLNYSYVKGILSNWLAKGRDNKEAPAEKSKVVNYDNSRKSNLKFTDYEQRTYDYDSLERKLLGWDKDVEEN